MRLKTTTSEGIFYPQLHPAFSDVPAYSMRMQLASLHINEIREAELRGERPVVGQKRTFSKTRKEHVLKNVKRRVVPKWRREILEMARTVRQSMDSPPPSKGPRPTQRPAFRKEDVDLEDDGEDEVEADAVEDSLSELLDREIEEDDEETGGGDEEPLF